MKKLVFYVSLSLGMIMLSNCNNDKNASTSDKQEIAGTIAKNDTKLKRYMTSSGIVKYTTKISGKMMGSTISGSGTEELYFKDWGNVELKKTDSKKVTKMNIFGQKKTDVVEEHTINKLDNGKSYSVDNKRKLIYLRRDAAMEMMKTFNDGDVVNPGEKMLESIGGKKIGKDNILGYSCDLWEIPGGKQWIYKGLPLKLQMTVMGITTTNVATSAKFDINVPDKYFELPDYPIQKEEGFQNDADYAKDKVEMKKNAKKMQNLSYEDYKKMVLKDDPEAKNMSEKEMKQGYQMMQMMAKKIGNN